MHEASLMTGLMRRIDEIAKAERAQRITSVSVWLGSLSHMSGKHFEEHFERAAAGTLAEGARLEVTISDDMHDVRAQEILLTSVEVEN
jgi:hydrogenase nickel incorporation protein HypA/HybF